MESTDRFAQSMVVKDWASIYLRVIDLHTKRREKFIGLALTKPLDVYVKKSFGITAIKEKL